ncbi:MAG: DUF3772 domain-containing protein, partial [Pseudomonadota bacterium]
MMDRVIKCLLVAVLVMASAFVTVLPQPSYAQQAELTEDELQEWQRLSARAEEAISNARASTPAFEALRADLVLWRDIFVDAQEVNSRVIETVQRQIEALGAVPEDGVESESITEERASLVQRLADLRAPVRSAELAFSQADGLIKSVDTIVRDRQAAELLELGPSPLNPSNWLPALNVLRLSAEHIRGEFVAAWANEVQQSETKRAFPLIVLLVVGGLVLIVRGRRWSRIMTDRVLGEDPGAGRWIIGFVLSLGSLILPIMGIHLLVRSVYATGLIGLRLDQILETVVPAAFIFLFARWLATRIFPAVEARSLPLNLNERQRRAGRWFGASLGLTVGLHFLLQNVGT